VNHQLAIQLPTLNKARKKHLWLYIVGGFVLLCAIVFASFFIPSQRRADEAVATQLQALRAHIADSPAHSKEPFTNCSHGYRGFFVIEFGCESVGEIFYKSQGNAQSIAASLTNIDTLLKARGWRAVEEPNSFKNHLPSVIEIQQAKDQNDYSLTDIRYTNPTDANTSIHLVYFAPWMDGMDRSYDRVRKGVPLSGDQYAYGLYIRSESLRALL